MAPPRLYDAIMGPAERGRLGALRAELLRDLRGVVVDVGAGTGASVGALASATHVLVDPDLDGLRSARGKGATRLVVAGAERLPLADAVADAIVFTLSLCTIPSPDAALREARRVLRPGGVLVALEHEIAPGRALALAQRLLTPAWKHLAAGCHLDRDTQGAIAAAGFRRVSSTTAFRQMLTATRWSRP